MPLLAYVLLFFDAKVTFVQKKIVHTYSFCFIASKFYSFVQEIFHPAYYSLFTDQLWIQTKGRGSDVTTLAVAN